MPNDVIIDVNDRQQASSALIQNNNGNDRSLTSTGVGAQEKSTRIIDLLENKVAKMLGVLVCGWVLLVLVQGGMVGSLETKDCGFVTLLFFLVFFRCWRHYCPQAYWSLSGTTRSLLADYFSRLYIDRLFYWSRLVFAVFSVVLSVMRLALQDFGKKEVENKESRDFALKVFYGLTLAEALVLLFAEALSFPRRWNSVGLADGSGDGLEVGLTTRGNSVGLTDGAGDGLEVGLTTGGNSVGFADGAGDGLEVGLITGGNSVGFADGPGDGAEDGLIVRGNSVGLADGPGDGPGNGPGDSPGDGPEDRPADGPENGPRGEPEDGSENGPGGEPGDGSGDVPVNQSNECNAVGPADCHRNLRRRQKFPRYCLVFLNEVKGFIYTNELVRAENGHPIIVAIWDMFTRSIISTDCSLSSAIVILTVLDAEVWENEGETWGRSEFDQRVFKGRKGKGPILTGPHLTIQLKNGVGTFENIICNYKSSGSRAKSIRLWVMVKGEGEQGYLNGTRVQEGVSESFWVLDHRLKGNHALERCLYDFMLWQRRSKLGDGDSRISRRQLRKRLAQKDQERDVPIR